MDWFIFFKYEQLSEKVFNEVLNSLVVKTSSLKLPFTFITSSLKEKLFFSKEVFTFSKLYFDEVSYPDICVSPLSWFNAKSNPRRYNSLTPRFKRKVPTISPIL